MTSAHGEILRNKMSRTGYEKLTAIANPAVHQFIADAIELCEPESVFVSTDTKEDIDYIRRQALTKGEEKPLSVAGHTYHFDGMQDQGRDREVTKYLVPRSESLSKALNQVEREEGLAEIRHLLQGSMRGREMIVRFLSLGPTGSVFSIPCVQVTDSFYVAHSEDLLYRPAYEECRRVGGTAEFFRFLHSAGRLTPEMTSAEPDKKRIYIDYTTETIYSANTQYAGNTVGLKKLALRLTIRKADREGWLAEHMFLMGVHGPNGRKTYFAGAFPSACGKTSTAMLRGETIMGDDIAYFRALDGKACAVNAEAGIFGIIQDINAQSDPVIWKALTSPGEVIFSNILIHDSRPHWLGMNCELPKKGVNFSGEWFEGKYDAKGQPIPPAHKNARYTITLPALANVDRELNNPTGVEVGGIVYGGRDAHACHPVQESFSWEHGIIAYGASLETETTFAIIGKEGVTELNVMSIQDFLAIPIGKYIQNNLQFVRGLKRPPKIFGVNYFLRNKEGKFLNAVADKAVWIKWMELRAHGDVGAIRSATGWIPKHDDLRKLFQQVLDKAYTEQDYIAQFTLRVNENLGKLERVEKFFRAEGPAVPPVLFQILSEQRQRLLKVREAKGDYVTPAELEKLGL